MAENKFHVEITITTRTNMYVNYLQRLTNCTHINSKGMVVGTDFMGKYNNDLDSPSQH